MKLLSALFEVTAYSAVLFAAVMGFKLAFKSRLSPALHFALWFLVIARLCIPVTVESDFHFFAASKPGGEAELQIPVPEAPKERTTAFTGGEAISDAPSVEAPAPTSAAAAIPAAAPKRKPVSSWADALTALWIAGMAFRAARLLFSERSMRHAVAHNTLPTDARTCDIYDACCAELGIAHKLPLQSMAGIYSPALTVSLKPMILLPANITDTLSEAQLAYALRHELMHYRRRDHLLALLLLLLTCVYWFNPVVWLMKRELMKDMETACDSAVTARLNGAERREYAMTLLALFSQPYRVNSVLGMALSSAEKDAERRVRGVFGAHRSKAPVKILAALLSALLLACCFTTACQPTPSISPIVGEQDGKDSLIISGQGSDGKKGEKASADSFPQKYNDQIDFPKANMIIRYDADISAEGIEGASIYTVQRLKRSDDENIRLVNMFSQGASLYEYAQANKAYWANVLIKLKQKSANGDYDEQFDVNSVVREIEEKIKNSPESTGRTAFGWENHDQNELCIVDFENDGGWEQAQFERNGNYFYYAKYPDSVLQAESMVQAGDAISGEPAGTTISITVSEKAAADQADKLVNDICSGSYSRTDSKARLVTPYTGEIITNGWLFTYAKRIGGLTAYLIGRDCRINNGVSPALVAPWESELIEVFVDEAGVAVFDWQGAVEEIGKSDSGSLVGLDELISIVTNQMKYCHANKGNPEHQCVITINKICLGTGLLASANTNQEQGQYTPSWYVFYDLQIDGIPELYFEDCMVFSAIDGRYVEPRMTTRQLMEMQ